MAADKMAGRSTREIRLELCYSAAVIIIAFNLAIAEPILSTLGNGAEFFIAHDSSRFEILGTAMLFTLFIPLSIAAIVATSRFLGPRMLSISTQITLSILLAIWSMRFIKAVFEGLSGGVQLTIAIILGVSITLMVSRWQRFRDTIPWLMLAPFVILIMFVFISPSSKLIFQSEKILRVPDAPDTSIAIGNPVPIFMLVFDELPIASLVTQEGTIDSANFPNFARLAGSSTWYRNASTLDDHTNWAVPTILDGLAPDKSTLPIAADHPENLFRLLSSKYRISAIEPITHLCVTAACTQIPWRDNSGHRWSALLMDATVVIGHIILPDFWTQRLPAITETWGNFGHSRGSVAVGQLTTTDPVKKDISLDQIKANNQKAIQGDHVGDFADFLRLIEKSHEPFLLFNHVMLPHRPWQYLPSGQRYPFLPHPGRVKGRWGSNEWLLRQAYQRHMLQLGLADRLLGDFLDQLQIVDSFDEALVIVVADHGVAFELGAIERGISKDTIGSLAAIPLFVKYPGQSQPVVDDRPATTLDLMPTILDVLDISGTPTKYVGESLRKSSSIRSKRYIADRRGWLSVPVDGSDKYHVVDRKYELLGVAGKIDWFAITPRGLEELIGRKLDQLTITDTGELTTTLTEGIEFYRNVKLDQPLFPGLIDGQLKGEKISDPVILAVAVNGSVSAVTEAFMAARPGRWHAMLPPDSFHEGANRIDIFEVESADGKFILRPVHYDSD